MYKRLIVQFFFTVGVLGGLSSCSQDPIIPDPHTSPPPAHLRLVGNDRDAHGCIPSAGYLWCEKKQKCVRPWLDKECFPSMNTEKASPPKK